MTAGLSPYVTSIRIRDAAGLASDTATIDVEDSYGRLRLPEAGALISIGLGWEGGTALVMFDGVVDDIGSTGGRGQGRMLTISAKSADTRGPLKEKQEKHKDKASFGAMATEWGQVAGLSEVAIHPELAAVEPPWWGMQGESYLAWGTRHARGLGATFKVVGTRAVFVPRSQGQSATGKPLQAIRAAWGENLISWSLKPVLGRPAYGRFRINWFDDKQAKWKSEAVEAVNPTVPTVATDRIAAATKADAQTRAGSRRTEAEREGGGGTVAIDGEPAAQAETECEVTPGRQIGVHPRCSVGSTRGGVDRPDAGRQPLVRRSLRRGRPAAPRMIAAGGAPPGPGTPGTGTWWRSVTWPGARSRTRRPGWDRAGLPREPGRGFCQDVPFLAQPAILSPQPLQLGAILQGHTVTAARNFPISLGDPVPERLRRRLILPRQFLRRAPGTHQLDHLAPELRRIRRSCSWHRGLLLPKLRGVHENGSSPLDDHPAAVAVGDLETDGRGRPQSSRIGRRQRHPGLQAGHGLQEPHHFVGPQHNR